MTVAVRPHIHCPNKRDNHCMRPAETWWWKKNPLFFLSSLRWRKHQFLLHHVTEEAQSHISDCTCDWAIHIFTCSTVCSSHQQQRPNRIHLSDDLFEVFHLVHELKFAENSADTSTPLAWWQSHAPKIACPTADAVSSEPCCQHLNHGRLLLVMSHKSFITSSLALEVIKFPFLLCVPLLTDSRWGTRPFDQQTTRNRGMSLLIDTGASLNCLWSGLLFVF